MNGILSGGWNYVVAAYAMTAIVLFAYCAHAINAARKEQS